MDVPRQFSALLLTLLLLGGLPVVGPGSRADDAKDKEPEFKTAPPGALVLFNGKDLAGWVSRKAGQPAEWKVQDGYMEVVPGKGDVVTREKFGDCDLHVEFWLPLMADKTGQARANSGVYLQGRY